MNVLIADDDRFVVSALEKKINWGSLGIEQIYTAFNIRQAQNIFSKQPIDILISDIEMPQGSGLELLAWIRSEGYDVETIYLTNFADFNYAQKAIELQSFEYYLKPIEFDKLELIIKKAVNKVKSGQKDEEAMKVGQYWKENKDELREHFWDMHLTRDEMYTVEDLQKELETKHIDYSLGDQFLPLLINFFPYQLIDYKEVRSIFTHESNLRNQLKMMIQQAFQHETIHLDGMISLHSNHEEYLIIFKMVDTSLKESYEEWMKSCHILIEKINNGFHCDLQCFLGPVVALPDVKYTINHLKFAQKEHIRFRNEAFLMADQTATDAKYMEPNLERLEHYLETENTTKFISRCEQYVKNLVDKNEANRSIIRSFKVDITQLIYTHLKKKEIHAHQLFQGKILDFLQDQSMRSIEDLINFLSYLVDVSIDYIQFTNSQKTVVQKICDYIDQNYEENISRSTIAEALYLSPDYVARIFKKETGISLINYLIKKRIEVAKELLANTNHPVHLISDKVGYGNYSYFTKIFKKETNTTPMDYRKLSKNSKELIEQ